MFSATPHKEIILLLDGISVSEMSVSCNTSTNLFNHIRINVKPLLSVKVVVISASKVYALFSVHEHSC